VFGTWPQSTVRVSSPKVEDSKVMDDTTGNDKVTEKTVTWRHLTSCWCTAGLKLSTTIAEY
jgi:hypothetical protein